MDNSFAFNNIDWSQFKKDDKFVFVCSLDIKYHEYMNIVDFRYDAALHPDFEMVMKRVIDDNGSDLDDVCNNIEFDVPSEPGIYEVLCELSDDGNAVNHLNFRAFQYEKTRHVPMIYFEARLGTSESQTSDKPASTVEDEEQIPLENLQIKW